jgi:hypothetical protein
MFTPQVLKIFAKPKPIKTFGKIFCSLFENWVLGSYLITESADKNLILFLRQIKLFNLIILKFVLGLCALHCIFFFVH